MDRAVSVRLLHWDKVERQLLAGEVARTLMGSGDDDTASNDTDEEAMMAQIPTYGGTLPQLSEPGAVATGPNATNTEDANGK